MEWVKCSERTPENIGYYVSTDGRSVKECFWTGKYWQRCDSWDYKAIWWMPLPEPPKEDE